MEVECFVQNIISSLLGLLCLQERELEPTMLPPLERCGCGVALSVWKDFRGQPLKALLIAGVSTADCILAGEGRDGHLSEVVVGWSMISGLLGSQPC